jgi:hypothetical protein
MEVIGRGDEHGVDGRLLLQHLAEVGMHGALVIWRLAGVALLDFRPHRTASRFAAVVRGGQVPLLGRVRERDDLTVLLGATNRGPPSTCRGTIVMAAAAQAAVEMNWRRVGGEVAMVLLIVRSDDVSGFDGAAVWRRSTG